MLDGLNSLAVDMSPCPWPLSSFSCSDPFVIFDKREMVQYPVDASSESLTQLLHFELSWKKVFCMLVFE